jgi:hypothetical protein
MNLSTAEDAEDAEEGQKHGAFLRALCVLRGEKEFYEIWL